jgi:hypothetical protein
MLQKVKVKLSLCLSKHRAMKRYWGSGGISMALAEGDWSASRPAALHPCLGPPAPTGKEAGWPPDPVWTR